VLFFFVGKFSVVLDVIYHLVIPLNTFDLLSEEAAKTLRESD